MSGRVTPDPPQDVTPDPPQDVTRTEVLVTSFKQLQLEQEAQKNWDLFYKRNSTHFFKDRHWTSREFQELRTWKQGDPEPLVLLEAGCGVGNLFLPLLEDQQVNVFVHACDFSPRAVDLVQVRPSGETLRCVARPPVTSWLRPQKDPRFRPERCRVFACDLTRDDLRLQVPEAGLDVATLVFVLSAVHPDKMKDVLLNIRRVLKAGGVVLFRDYGVHDHAMTRFKTSSKLGENFYVRQDGTRSYFFSKDFLAQMFSEAGFLCVANEYVTRETVNRKEGLSVGRVFLQSRFMKTNHHTETGSADPPDA